MVDHQTVPFGADEHGNAVHEIPVYPQRHAYIENRVGKFADGLADGLDLGAEDAGALLATLGSKAYDLLCALIPNLSKRIPEYEFRGYGSREAYESGEYEEGQDRSPSFPQIVNAFEVAIKVNRFDVFKVLGGLFDPKLLKAEANSLLAGLAERASSGLPSSSGTSTESAQTSSGMTDPTSAPSGPPLQASASESPNGSGSLLTTSA